MRQLARIVTAGLACAALTACASTPTPPTGARDRTASAGRPAERPPALPSRPRSYAEAWPEKARPGARPEPRRAAPSPRPGARPGVYKVGPPYQVRGVWYVPAEQPEYEDVGVASWYGDEFHGKSTANGEVFDAALVTGAHTTLPLPSLVEVTNLENGRAVKVRINDRGPFEPGRILDLSRAAAEELGFRAKGTANVRVRYLGRADGMTVAAREPARRGPLSLPGFLGGGDDGGWAVQAGAFSQAERADRVADALKAAGRTSIKPLERDGRTLYRVLVGPWRDQDTALEARGQVAALGFADAKVVEAF